MDEYYYPNESLKKEHTNKIMSHHLQKLKENKTNANIFLFLAIFFIINMIPQFLFNQMYGLIISCGILSILSFIAYWVYLHKRPALIKAINEQKDVRKNEVLILQDKQMEYQYSENQNSYIMSIDYKNIDVFEYDWEYIEVYAQNAGDIVRKYKDTNMFDYYVDHTFSSDSFAVPCYIIDNDEILDSIRKRKKDLGIN